MRGDVAALVVAVESEVEAQDVVEALVLFAAFAEEDGEIVGPVLGAVEFLFADGVDFVGAEDEGGDAGDLGEEGDAVVEGGLPVVGLVHALGVLFGEGGFGVECGHGHGELGHGVHVAGEGFDHGQDVLGQVRFFSQFARERPDLRGGGHLARQEQPEHGFGEHLGARSTLGQFLLAVLDGAAVEADALVGVEDGALPDHGLEASHAANSAGDGDIANLLFAVFLQLLEEGALGGDDLLQDALELGLGGSGIRAGTNCARGRRLVIVSTHPMCSLPVSIVRTFAARMACLVALAAKAIVLIHWICEVRRAEGQSLSRTAIETEEKVRENEMW